MTMNKPRRIGLVSTFGERCWLPKDDLVEEVVDQVHLLGWITLRSINRTVKIGVCDTESGFPNVGELCRTLCQARIRATTNKG